MNEEDELLARIEELATAYPDIYRRAMADPEIAEMAASIKDTAQLQLRSLSARIDNPEGFAHFVWCVTEKEIPPHVYYCWILPTYYAHGRLGLEQLSKYYECEAAEPYRFVLTVCEKYERDVIGCVVYAARELAKTTYNTVLWVAFRIGHEPFRANMIVQVGDDSAKKNAAKVADIIDRFEGWKAVFPNVVPDKDKGWGDRGYEVKDVSKSDAEWNKLNATRQDATLAGYGIGSGSLIGKHPDGVLIADDIHNEDNTISQKELDNTLSVVQGTLFYAMTHDTWVTFVGTPWVEGDTLDFVASTGEYIVIKVPAYLENKEGAWLAPSEYDEDSEKVYMWPEERGEDWVRRKFATTVPREFKRMVLLTLSRADVSVYTYSSFPHKDINYDWPMRTGVDPVAAVAMVRGMESGVSHFAMADALKTPYNNVVISGGLIEKCDFEAGERYVVQKQRKYPHTRFSIETDGAGAAFIAVVARSPGVKWDGFNVREIGRGSKEQRQYTFLQPLLKNGLVRVSDEDTPFLNIFRKYLDRFGLFRFAPDAPELDVADAVVLAVFAIPEVWSQVVINPVNLFAKPKQRKSDPYIDMVAMLNRR